MSSRTVLASLAMSHLGGRALTDVDTDTTQQAIVAKQWFDQARKEFLACHPWNFAIKREAMTTTYVSLTGIADSGGLIQITKASHGLTTRTRVYIKDVEGVEAANGQWFITSTGANTFTLDDSEFSGTYTTGGEYVVIPQFNWDFRHALPADCLRVLKIGGDEDSTKSDSEDFVIENGYILCDNEEPNLRYVYDNTTYTAWPAYAQNAFSYLLASYMAQNITGPAVDAVKLRQSYEQVFLPKAKAQDAREAKPKRALPFEQSEMLNARGGW
jgi:hypothetical protein